MMLIPCHWTRAHLTNVPAETLCSRTLAHTRETSARYLSVTLKHRTVHYPNATQKIFFRLLPCLEFWCQIHPDTRAIWHMCLLLAAHYHRASLMVQVLANT